MNNERLLEVLRRNRFSALIDGICMGVGFVFILLGIFIPMTLRTYNQTINGLLAVIGGVLAVAIGGIMEVYHSARVPLIGAQELEGKRWFGLLLRCRSCDERTGHVLTSFTNPDTGEIEKTYECMQCGETKKIYELTRPVKSTFEKESIEVA